MYAGQLEMISFLSVADTSFAKHVGGVLLGAGDGEERELQRRKTRT